MSYTNATNLGVQHSEWLRTLDFYKDELAILQKRLDEVAAKNTSPDAMARLEQFQNQFIVQRNNIDEYKHSINEHAHQVYEDLTHHAGKVEETLVEDHKKLEASMGQLEKIINDMRKELNAYLSKWM